MVEGHNSSVRSRRAYGDDLAANFGAEDAPHIVTRTVQNAELAVTELLVESPPGRMGDPIPRQNAYLVCCQLRDRAGIEYWEEGRAFAMSSLRAGDTTIHDLRRDPMAMIDCSLHTLMWFVPYAALNEVADEANVGRVDELRFDPCNGVADETIRQLSAVMLPALKAPEQVNRLFADHVALGLAAHVAYTYGGMQTGPRFAKGGLAPWQERRAKEMLVADLSGATSLTEVATACGLSAAHFSRAFCKSTGSTPHAWLLAARVERAMVMLRRANMSLSEIARSCGFADRSHLSRVFARHTGQSPGLWRRQAIR